MIFEVLIQCHLLISSLMSSYQDFCLPFVASMHVLPVEKSRNCSDCSYCTDYVCADSLCMTIPEQSGFMLLVGVSESASEDDVLSSLAAPVFL